MFSRTRNLAPATKLATWSTCRDDSPWYPIPASLFVTPPFPSSTSSAFRLPILNRDFNRSRPKVHALETCELSIRDRKIFLKRATRIFRYFHFVQFLSSLEFFSIYWDLDLGISFRGNYWEYRRDFSNKNSNVLRAFSLILRDEVIYNFLILNILPVETKILNHISTWILHSPK